MNFSVGILQILVKLVQVEIFQIFIFLVDAIWIIYNLLY